MVTNNTNIMNQDTRENFLDAFDGTLNINLEKLYISLFSYYPSLYGLGFDKENILAIENIDYNKFKSIFPEDDDVHIKITNVRMPTEPVSCVEDEEDEDESYIYEYWVTDRCIRPDIIIVNMTRKYIAKIGADGILFFYEQGFDYENEIKHLIENLPKRPVKNTNRGGKIHLVCNDGNGFYTVESRINKTNIDIDKHYNDDFKPVYDNIVKFLDKDNRNSGIVILNGAPGTGKTSFIRHLVTNVPGNYIFLDNAISEHISSPELISFLIMHKDSIFILEDCENVVADRRATGFSGAVSAILNMADGLMSDIFNGKFICTFNTEIGKIDYALLRKGRCFGKYNFKKLEEKKAEALLKERGFDVKGCGDMTLADIYHYETNNTEDSPSERRIGFGAN